MRIINTTPHEIKFKAPDGNEFVVGPCGVLINAKPEELLVGRHPSGAELVKVKFSADEAEMRKLQELEIENPDAIIVGSIIAAQAFPGRVYTLIAAVGYERVPVDQKKMRSDKFTIF